jgi:hypothetical protein
MVGPGIVAVCRSRSDGLIMRRVIVIAAAGISLAGCSSFSMDVFKSSPPPPPVVQLQLDSTPQGADARTSVGQGCTTPCTAAVPAPDGGFSVTFSMKGFQPATVPVQVTKFPGDFTTPASVSVDPNPVFAELRPAGPPPKPPRRKVMRPKKPRSPKSAPGAPPAADPAFPAPAPAPAAPPPPRQ